MQQQHQPIHEKLVCIFQASRTTRQASLGASDLDRFLRSAQFTFTNTDQKEASDWGDGKRTVHTMCIKAVEGTLAYTSS